MKNIDKLILLLFLALSVNTCAFAEYNEHYDKGSAAMDNKDYKTAIAEYKKSAKTHPYVSYLELGNAYALSNHPKKASKAFTKAIKTNPDKYEAYALMAMMANALNDTNKEILFINKALQCQNADLQARLGLAKRLQEIAVADKK